MEPHVSFNRDEILYPDPVTKDFWMVYGERLEDIKNTIELLKKIYQGCLQKDHLSAVRLNMFANVQESLIKYEGVDKLRIGYSFSSLLDLIAYGLMKSLGGDYETAPCKLESCGNWFIKQPKNKEYCSTTCNNNAYNATRGS